MYGTQDPEQTGPLVQGRAGVNIEGLKIDLGTLGGKNSWTNYNGINERGEAVGLAETAVPDPDGEDVCAFGTTPYVSSVSLAKRPHERSPDTGRK